jgi:AAA+ ATPase superfamily predicted ATPase
MRFIDRQHEMERLNGLLSSSNGALAVVWGQRRVGETRLLLEWCRALCRMGRDPAVLGNG